MGRIRVAATTFAVALAAGLSAATAFAAPSTYYPTTSMPVSGALVHIEDALDGTVNGTNGGTTTLVFPVPAGKTLATDIEFYEAVNDVVAAILQVIQF